MPSSDVPFVEGEPDPDPTESAAPAHLLTTLEYAVQVNPGEHWLVCCVCGCAGDCSSYDFLDRGLLLLGDDTLGRAAWCRRLGCSGEKYSSIYIPWKVSSQ